MKKILDVYDATLTPMAAKSKGYKYIEDVYYDTAHPHPDILELLTKHGHILGVPKMQKNSPICFGLYAKL